LKARKLRQNAGFSLIEVVAAILILGLVLAPVGGALATALRLNARTDETMRAQLAVTAAVENLLAEGVPDDFDPAAYAPLVVSKTDGDTPGTYQVTVSDAEGYVTVVTVVRPAAAPEEAEP